MESSTEQSKDNNISESPTLDRCGSTFDLEILSSDERIGSRIGSRITIPLLQRILHNCGDPSICLILPSGKTITTSPRKPNCSIFFRDYRTILRLLSDPLFQFGEAYSNRQIEIEGDLAECLTVIFRCMNNRKKPSGVQRLRYQMRRPTTNSLKESRHNIHHHYDLGNDFYRLWLDERMLYTCAYFARESFTLEQAQLAKMDHVCRKVRLRPGMQVVEAGCGWGALAMHMAKQYGVHVKAFNISAEQIAFAKREALRSGIENQVEFILDDWRTISGKFDAFVSVGMLEHVGMEYYSKLGQVIHRSLKPDGLGLIHTIGQNLPLPLNSWIERRIFPGAQIPTLKEMMAIFEYADFQILDLENLRLHYAFTLRHWLDRFEAANHIVLKKFDDRFVRMWRMYLAGSVAAFESGCLQLYQVVFANGESNEVPLTREHLYKQNFEQRVAK